MWIDQTLDYIDYCLYQYLIYVKVWIVLHLIYNVTNTPETCVNSWNVHLMSKIVFYLWKYTKIGENEGEEIQICMQGN